MTRGVCTRLSLAIFNVHFSADIAILPPQLFLLHGHTHTFQMKAAESNSWLIVGMIIGGALAP